MLPKLWIFNQQQHHLRAFRNENLCDREQSNGLLDVTPTPQATRGKGEDFPDSPMAKSLSANAKDKRPVTGPGRFHMPRSNSAHEPHLLKPTGLDSVLCNKKAAAAGNPSPATRGSPCAAIKTQVSQKQIH